jgi:hypothetical protein
MVTGRKQHSEKTPANQGPQEIRPEPNTIGASTPFDFAGKNLTPYGGRLPVQSIFSRFLAALHLNVALQILAVTGTLRERVWALARATTPRTKARTVTLPMLKFLSETRKYIWGELRDGDRLTGKPIGDHLRKVCAALPPESEADSRPGRFGLLLLGSRRPRRTPASSANCGTSRRAGASPTA